MKRRNFLQMLGVAPAAGLVAYDPPEWDNDGLADWMVRHETYGANSSMSNQEILRLAMDDRTAGYAELISNSNALLSHLKRAG